MCDREGADCCDVLAWMGEEEGNGQTGVLGVSLRLLLFDPSGLGWH